MEVIDISPSDDGDWMSMRPKHGNMRHVIHKSLFPLYAAHVINVNSFIMDVVPIRELYLEHTLILYHHHGRPTETIRLDVLYIEMLSHDVSLFLDDIINLSKTSLSNTESYYSLYSHNSVLVLSVEQHKLLLRGLTSLLERARTREDEFMVEFRKKLNL